jgi:hypothetical protein
MAHIIKILGGGAWLCLLPCFAVAQTLVNPVSMGFGKTDFSTPLVGSISLGSNGVVAYTGVFNGLGVGTAGQLEIAGTTGVVVEVSCTGGTLAHSGGATLVLGTELAMGPSNVGGWGTNPSCTGLGNVVATHTINATTTENVLYLGGQLNPSSLVGGAYSTALTGGTPITVRVLVQ